MPPLLDLTAVARLEQVELPRTPPAETETPVRFRIAVRPADIAGDDSASIAIQSRDHTLVVRWSTESSVTPQTNRRYGQFMADALNRTATALRHGFITTLGELYDLSTRDRLRSLLLEIGYSLAEVNEQSLHALRTFSVGRLNNRAYTHFERPDNSLSHRRKSARFMLAGGYLPSLLPSDVAAEIERVLGRQSKTPSSFASQLQRLSARRRVQLEAALVPYFEKPSVLLMADEKVRGAMRAATEALTADFIRQFLQTAHYSNVRQPSTSLTGRYAYIEKPLLAELRRAQCNPGGRAALLLEAHTRGNGVTFRYSNDGENKNGFVVIGRCRLNRDGIVSAIETGSAELRFWGSPLTAEHYHAEAAGHFRHALASTDELRAVSSALAGYWCTLQRGVNERGNAALAEYTLRAVLLARGIDLPLVPHGVSLDLEALIRGKDHFVETFATVFVPKHHAEQDH